MTDLKYNQVLNFDDGLLTVKISGHGGANGWATLSFKEEQFELDADGYQVVEIAPSELRELRDFLNRVIPSEPQSVREPSLRQAEDCLKDWLRYAEENLSEFDVEDGDCCEEKLCPKCESSGCIQYKIRETRIALASLAVSRPQRATPSAADTSAPGQFRNG